MEDLKNVTEKELVLRICNYIDRLKTLENLISKIMEKYNSEAVDIVKNEYKELKLSIKEEYKYLNKASNRDMRSKSHVHNSYWHGIVEANAYGFSSSVNSNVNFKLFESVHTAYYRMTKCISEEKWRERANG